MPSGTRRCPRRSTTEVSRLAWPAAAWAWRPRRPRPSMTLTPGGRLPYGSELIADIRTSARRESVGVAVEFGIFVNGYIPGPAAHDPASEHTQLMREANFVIHADK